MRHTKVKRYGLEVETREMRLKSPRVAVRAVIMRDDRLLLVNAWPDGRSELLCAPGGGVEAGASMPENLAREVHEETGLRVSVDAPCLVNEFHDPASGFHQVEIFFRCTVLHDGQIDPDWKDPENVVTQHYWVTRAEMASHLVKPDALARIAFEGDGLVSYDPLEKIVL